ncbi:MAG TPA: SGNH/GDSL hydrolase family protein [Verrucomicrobiales bacterium]|nr:SGNH/GDSL hydrolase family protein [Verrucomicrobiales bacterium]
MRGVFWGEARAATPVFLMAAALTMAASRAEDVLIVGDSLSREYAIEFPALFPNRPEAWGARNWAELLQEHRPERFDMGSEAQWFGAFAGFLGLFGGALDWLDADMAWHAYNWAIPGAESSDWHDILDEDFYFLLRAPMDLQIQDTAERAVVFLGGNDLKNHYGDFYDGREPGGFATRRAGNVKDTVEYLRDRNASMQIVVVGWPDVGVTPEVMTEFPDPERRALVTEMTRAINDDLRAWSEQQGIGFAEIFDLTVEVQGPRPFCRWGIGFEKGFDPLPQSNREQFLFSPDGFHPNTAVHIIFANQILEAFNALGDAVPIPLIEDEEAREILGLDPAPDYADWLEIWSLTGAAATADEDGDGLPLSVEFALGSRPDAPDVDSVLRLGNSGDENRRILSYRPDPGAACHVDVMAEESGDLKGWQVVPAARLRGAAMGWVDVLAEEGSGGGYVRLRVAGLPEPPAE